MSITATVKWFDPKKGFGFASPETGGEDIFVHQLNVLPDEEGKKPDIEEGDTIYYDLGDHNGRPTAMGVKLPLDRPKKQNRRPRGRNAKKEADAEAATEENQESMEAVDQAAAEMEKLAAPSADAASKAAGGGGGRDGKTHRRTADRPRRNDKGFGAKPTKGAMPQSSQDKRTETKEAARDVE